MLFAELSFSSLRCQTVHVARCRRTEHNSNWNWTKTFQWLTCWLWRWRWRWPAFSQRFKSDTMHAHTNTHTHTHITTRKNTHKSNNKQQNLWKWMKIHRNRKKYGKTKTKRNEPNKRRAPKFTFAFSKFIPWLMVCL